MSYGQSFVSHCFFHKQCDELGNKIDKIYKIKIFI